MKKISFKFIFAALAATAALAGCTKEITPPNFENDKVNPAAEGSRVIAVSFAAQSQTKTALEGLQPKFQDKDSILISNGAALDTCEVSVDGDNATISTNLTGPLKAVYPYKAAKLDGKNPNQIDTVFVSSVQSGTFADANICMAKDIANEAVFENKTAVLRFYVGSEIEVTSVTLESLSESFAPNIGTKITVEAPDGKTLYDQMPENQDRRVCYVAVPYGMHEQLTITTAAKNQTPEPKKLMKCNLAAGSMYTVFIPYYIDVDGQKWGYCNIGAFLPEEPGLYFAWGEVNGHKADTSKQVVEGNPGDYSYIMDAFSADFQGFDFTDTDRYTGEVNHSKGFSSKNTPYYLNSDDGFSKYTDSNLVTLQSSDDAATTNWGGGWRMPTCDEFETLINGTSTDKNDFVGGGLKIRGTELLFPTVGWADNMNLSLYAELDSKLYYSGFYWSSTLYSSEVDCAWHLDLLSDYRVQLDYGLRQIGGSIRPIYGPAPTPTEPDYVEMKMGTGDDAYTLKWRKMNLGATTVAGSYETCCGDYYAWGVAEPYYKTKTWSEISQQWDRTGFEWKDIAVGQDQDGDNVHGYRPEVYYQNSGIPAHGERIWKDEYEWNPAPYDNTKKLKQDYDAVVQANIGDGWRMPTIVEFNDLCKACGGNDAGSPELSEITSSTPGKGIYALSADQEFLPEYKGVAGLLLCDGESRLFFPTAGIIEDSKHSLGKDGLFQGFYWSGTYSGEFKANSFAFIIGKDYEGVNPQYSNDRHCGFPIRPVSD